MAVCSSMHVRAHVSMHVCSVCGWVRACVRVHVVCVCVY